jgi:fatty-acid desaturase
MKRNVILKKKIDALFVAGHLLTILYIYLLGWWSLLLRPFAMFVFHAGHGAYAHRIFTHDADKTFSKLSNNAHWLGHLFFNMTGWGSALTFGAIHRSHHKYSGTEQDPHEPKFSGKWNLFVGNYNFENYDRRFIRIRACAPYASWFHKNYFKVAWTGMPIFAPVFALAFWLRYVLLVMVHPNEDHPTAHDCWYLWPLLLGDEAHELHHKRAYCAKHHNLDFVYLCVKMWRSI